MSAQGAGTPAAGGEAEEYARGLIEAAALERLAELFQAERAGTIYRQGDRNGVATVVLPTSALREDELLTLLKYRMAQYIAVGFVDPRRVYEARAEHEDPKNVTDEDVHIIAGSAASGQILCYSVIRSLPQVPPGTTMRERNRPLFPTEQLYGWGVFNRLRILPDLPVAKVRELGRFVKNQHLPALDDLGTRGPVEVGIALFRTVGGPLRNEVDAMLGEIEEGVAGQNLAFFHVPQIVVRVAQPYEVEGGYLFLRYLQRVVYPFATLISDCGEALRTRIPAVERALALPGRQGIAALLALKREASHHRSSLAPGEDVQPLIETPLPQEAGRAMQKRGELASIGERLRAFPLFADLSPAEASTLGGLMERQEAAAGEMIVRRGDDDDALYLIEEGQAEAQITNARGERVTLERLGPGDYFGEIALLTGAERTADVVTLGAVSLLRLTREAYERYLGHAAEVERELSMRAARRAANVIRNTR